MSYRFRPPSWSWFALFPALALLIALGSWQMQRGFYKAQMQAVMDASSAGPTQPLTRDTAPASEREAPHLQAHGRYLGTRQLLLDNQGNDGRPGYHVWTPLRLDDGALLMVDRGWVAEDGDRSRMPETSVDATPREVSGLWRPLPQPGLRLAADACAGKNWPRVVQYPVAGDLRCLYADLGADLGEAPLAGLLLLDPALNDGYVRDWRINAAIPPQRHYAYAAQWYAFAATLLFLFVKLNLRRIS
ncbi:MAG: SURF1-like protein [Hydrocarboniphaga sp.]|uniref:SURF1 family protein n=1 Tax=Hydrocarboniphaga sp. TaxID=2033016 RepID=UPI002624249D|nr:SURF1 family protein [Hydrocarboniphaga sp.]MDB5973234.1 SURF1-like protein [Hydrocarboniphaga sp.]